MSNPLTADLNHVLAHTDGLWDELRGGRLFITGGTGFFGSWLLETFTWAVDKLGLETSAVVLTRNRDAFARKAPHLASHPALTFHEGDVNNFPFPGGPFSHVIHAATEASAALNAEAPLVMIDTIVTGTRHVLDFARNAGARKLLLTSSGAVYGRQPPELTHVGEDYTGGPDPTDPRSAYGEGKRLAELLTVIYSRISGCECKIARCYAFVGPYLPLDIHFAIGNFIRDALAGQTIRINGDGTPYRSYLYAADLAVWLWTILFRGQSCRPYNVGSGQALSIAEVAKTVAGAWGTSVEVSIARAPIPGVLAERYVPSVKRAEVELGLKETLGLSEAVRRTCRWQTERGKM
jgi:nucleoside-diphosphate-sugar epimerase